ncbi:MAG: sensor histidine kinase [Eubacteriales bacterium]|nr:sensor histidine kinase [Eubacteriales bacterium]
MLRWFGARKLRTKMMLGYTVFAVVPLLFITVYLYLYTSRIMKTGMYENLENQIDRMEQNLDDKTGGYYTVSNLLYMDETLWSYLRSDYTDQGYEELYFYVDGLFTNIRMLYPEIRNLCVISTNLTLPADGWYFFPTEAGELSERQEDLPQTGDAMELSGEPGQELQFIRLMNRYETGQYRNFLQITVDRSALGNLMEAGTEGYTAALVNREGIVQISNRSDLVGKSREELDLKNQILRERDTAHCGKLILYTDPRTFHEPLNRAVLQLLGVFFACAALAFTAIERYSWYFQKNVKRVMDGARQISFGRFEYRIEAAGADEIGKIAQSINTLGEQLQKTIQESYEKELKRKISELNQLQEQINPHFLYNALSSLSYMAVNNGDSQTGQAIVYLADFYRISLNKGKQELSIREELRLLESYMQIQKMRFSDSIMVEYDLDETLLDCRVMKLTLQPIVENAIHHGRTDDEEVLHIIIRLYRDGGKTVLEVIDDGRGIPPDKLMELQTSMDQSAEGYGLRNVNIRIRLQYGAACGVSLESEEGFGTRVRIELP